MLIRLKEVLSEQGLTAKELAERMGVTPQYISGIARGAGSASIEALSKIATALNVPLASLFTDYKSGIESKCPHCGQPITIKIE